MAVFDTYLNMRENLFKYLEKIELFEYLKKTNLYWNTEGDYKILWDEIFINKEISENCGIQLTQACNCAILKRKANGEYDNSEPRKKVVADIINQFSPDCLFSSFNITEKLRLIIFLDTPFSEGSFHQRDFFENSKVGRICKEKGIEYISITHPSNENRSIYNNLDCLLEKSITAKNQNSKSKYENANILLQNAIDTINELRVQVV